MNSQLKKQTISGFIWKFGERILAQLVSLIVSIVLARILLPDDYGIVAIVTVFITLANCLVTSGFGTSLVQKKDSDELDFSTMFWASVIFSFILYALLFFASPFIANIYKNSDITLVLRVMGLRLPIGAINSIQHSYVQKKMIFKKFFFATFFGTAISAAIGIYMAINNYGAWALVAQYLINVVVDTIVLSFIIKWRPSFSFSYTRFKTLFGFGWRVLLADFIGVFFNELRALLIGFKYQSSDLAFYNRGHQIPSLVSTNVEQTIISVAFPSISKIQDDKHTVKLTLKKMTKLCSFVMFPILVGIFAVSDSLVRVLLTDKWIEAVSYMRILSISGLFSIMTSINLQGFKAIGDSKTLLSLEFIKKPLYLIIIIVCMFISPFAIACGSAFYSIIAFFINAFPSKKCLNYSIVEQLSDIFPSLILSVIMCCAVVLVGFLPINITLVLILQIVTGVIVYVVPSLIFKFEAMMFILDTIKGFFKKENLL